MHYKIALIFLLGITAINARVIARFNYPTNHAQALGDLRLPSCVQEPYYVVETEPQPYPYDRVLPEVEEPTDFQPLEQQVTQVADNVKNVKQSVNDFENYLQGVAATSTPQNKAKSEVLRITMEYTLKLGEVPISSLAEKIYLTKSILVEIPTNSESIKREKEEDIIEEDSTKMEKEWENHLSSIIKNEIKDAEEIANLKIKIENLNSFNDYTELENRLSNMLREDNTDIRSNGANDLSQKADRHNNDEKEIDESLDSYLNKIFTEAQEDEEEIDEEIEKATAEAWEEEEIDEEIEKATAISNYKDLEESEGSGYLNSIFASSPSLKDDYFIR